MSEAMHEFQDGHDHRSKPGLAVVAGTFPVDEAVVEAMPYGIKVIYAAASGSSEWTVTARVQTILPDGTPKAYFLKRAIGEHGRTMMFGEFTSVTTIHDVVPGLIPAPRGWGRFKAGSPDTYFFLSDFVDMENSAPNPFIFTKCVADMHLRGTSPNGMFGFPVTTCDGKMPHTVDWESSWAVFFAKLIRGVLKLDTETNGRSPELEASAEQVIKEVIPRLCGVLQSEGRQIKASLIHGDLWSGNVGTRKGTGDIVFYDAGSYYAHNEMDLGSWRCSFCEHLRKPIYFESYFKNFEKAEPAEEWEDRNRLYSLKYHLNYSAGHPKSPIRETVYNDMCYLCEKYAPLETLGRYDAQKDPRVTDSRIVAHAEHAPREKSTPSSNLEQQACAA